MLFPEDDERRAHGYDAPGTTPASGYIACRCGGAHGAPRDVEYQLNV